MDVLCKAVSTGKSEVILPSLIATEQRGAVATKDAIKDVFIEELGHWWQSQSSAIDLRGDEGELLLALIENQPLTSTEIERIKQENDHQWALIDGVMTLMEKASLACKEAFSISFSRATT